jgi:hypothetical protein
VALWILDRSSVLVASVLFLVASADAERSPYRAPLRGEIESKGFAGSRFTAQITGHGIVAFHLGDRRNGPSNRTVINGAGREVPELVTQTVFRGTAQVVDRAPGRTSRTRSVPVTGSVVVDEGGGSTLHAYFSAPGTGGTARVYSLRATARAGGLPLVAKVSHVPTSFLKGARCGSSGNELAVEPPHDGEVHQAPRSTTTPPHRYATTGSNEITLMGEGVTNSQMVDVVNACAPTYESQVGVGFKVIKATQNTNSRVALGKPDGDLQRFLNIANQGTLGRSDTFALFSTANAGGVAGVATLGTLCSSRTASATVIYYKNPALSTFTFCHEMGHSFGATHSRSGLMIAVVNTARQIPTEFSDSSLQQIERQLRSRSQCLADSTGEAIPTPAGESDTTGETRPLDGTSAGGNQEGSRKPFPLPGTGGRITCVKVGSKLYCKIGRPRRP